MAGYTRQSSFADGDTITSALFNNEYNQLVNAFSNTSGHSHDGTAASGPVIGLIGDAGETSPNNKVLIDTTNNYIEFYVEVSSNPVQQLYIADGAIIPVTDSDVDLGTSSLYFKNAYIDSITTTGNVAVGGNLTVTGTTTFNGGTITMGDAATDNVVFGADIDSNIIPDDDDSYDLGSSSQEWRDLYIDGTAHIDTLDVDVNATIAGTLGVTGVLTGTSLDISGDIDVDGTTNLDVVDIDGAVDMATTLAVAGNVDFNGDLDVDGTTNLDVVDIDGAVDMATTLAVAGNVDFNGDLDVDGTTNLDVVDIDGAVDMATTLTVGGEITAASLDISGNVDIDGTLETDALSINSTAVTSTAAELNILDGVTSTAAELNILDGVTSTATELNLLDGVTSTTAELNILDGVTASATDINLIDGITNGTVIASKAIITDANKDITGGRNITITGELDAATLDISGDADIDGTLEADAITIGGITLAETISDTVGAMVSSNTETNITVSYDDSDNTLDFVIGTLNQDTTGLAATATALATARTIHGVSFDGTANIDLTEVVQDTVGAMFTSNTESGITVAYQDADGTVDFTVGTLNQDTTGNAATATALATARTIGGTSFDGTANIAVNLSATATALATARTIGGVSFDGTANIVPTTFNAATFSGDLNVDSGVLFADVSTNRVGINQASPDVSLDAGSNTDAIHVPSGTTAQRPASPAAGYFRYNSTTGDFEGYTDDWGAIAGGGGGTAPAINTMTGDGSDTTLTLTSAPANENATVVTIDGVVQHKDTYAVSGTTLTFSEAPPTGTKVECITWTNTAVNSALLVQDADGDTKIQVEESSDEDKIRFDTGGTERMIIDSTGVGIGTSSPARALEINSGSSPIIESVASGSNNSSLRLRGSLSTGHYWDIQHVHSDNDLSFGWSGSEKVRITDTGNVGIGATSPSNKLDIVDSTGGFAARITNNNDGSQGLQVRTSDNDTGLYILDLQTSSSATGTNYASQFVVEKGGNVGIGTTSPAQMLTLSNGTFQINGSSSFSSNVEIGRVGGDNNMGFATGGSERMRISSGGQLLVGTTSALQSDNTMSLAGSATGAGSAIMDIRNTSSNDNCGVLSLSKATTTTTSANRFIYFYTNNFGTGMGAIAGNGATNVQFVSASDERLKENIKPLTGSLDKVLALNPVSYTWKENGDHIKAGFIAQEVEKVLPEYTDTEDDEMKTKSITGGMTAGYIAVLTKAIQEQQTQIEALQSEINLLKGE
ncbi:tail fiber domain-containing protein [Akkermansiaceae bacterium]|nr:tail fiber domain-containing protein [Akkermansiaceae bacterium]